MVKLHKFKKTYLYVLVALLLLGGCTLTGAESSLNLKSETSIFKEKQTKMLKKIMRLAEEGKGINSPIALGGIGENGKKIREVHGKPDWDTEGGSILIYWNEKEQKETGFILDHKKQINVERILSSTKEISKLKKSDVEGILGTPRDRYLLIDCWHDNMGRDALSYKAGKYYVQFAFTAEKGYKQNCVVIVSPRDDIRFIPG